MIVELLLPGSDETVILALLLLVLTGLFIAYRKWILVRISSAFAPRPDSTAPPVKRVAKSIASSKRRLKRAFTRQIERHPPLPITHNPLTLPEEREQVTRRIMAWDEHRIATR
jgi:hypothetical protein